MKTKIKAKHLMNAFPIVRDVFDSIDKFSRTWELMPAYKEIKEAASLFEEKRNKFLLLHSDDKGNILPDRVTLVNQEMEARGEETIELKTPIKFFRKEVERAVGAKDATVKRSSLVHMLCFIADTPSVSSEELLEEI